MRWRALALLLYGSAAGAQSVTGVVHDSTTRLPIAGVVVELRTNVPPFAPEPGGGAEAFARRLAGDNGPPRVVAFAAEAGQFQRAGFSTVICGPGSIEQAHQPDEYVEISQMQRGAQFMRRLIEWASEE